jgi:uncharacterized membrane protein
MTSWNFSLRRVFIAGLLVLLPTAVAAYVLWIVFAYLDGILEPVVQRTLHRRVPGVGFFALLSLVFLIGLFTNNLLGARIVQIVSRWLERIPFYSPVYRTMRDISQVFLGDRASAFRRVGLVEWPQPGFWAFVFVMSESGGAGGAALGRDVVTVFLPTSPNPTTGFVHLVLRENVIAVELSVEQALKLLISGGAVQGMPSEAVKRVVPGRGGSVSGAA